MAMSCRGPGVAGGRRTGDARSPELNKHGGPWRGLLCNDVKQLGIKYKLWSPVDLHVLKFLNHRDAKRSCSSIFWRP